MLANSREKKQKFLRHMKLDVNIRKEVEIRNWEHACAEELKRKIKVLKVGSNNLLV